MKIVLLLFLTACVSIIQAQEIQGIFNYGLGGQIDLSANQLMPIRNAGKKIEMQKRAYEKYNQKHPEEKRVFNEQVFTYRLRTTHEGFYAGFSRNAKTLGLVQSIGNIIKDLDTIKISQNNIYLGYMQRWGYGKWKIEPFLGIQTDVLRWGKDIDSSGVSKNMYKVYTIDDSNKNYYNYNLYSGIRFFPLNFNIKFGFDLNITKKIALNITYKYYLFNGIKNVKTPYFSGSYLSLGLRYSIINNLKR